MNEPMHRFTREQLAAAFEIWQNQASEGGWKPLEDGTENACAAADHLISILESDAISG